MDTDIRIEAAGDAEVLMRGPRDSLLTMGMEKEPEGICIKVIFVPEPARRQGIGNALLKAAIEEYRRRWSEYPLYLLCMQLAKTGPSWIELRSWYERSGFFAVTQDHNSCVMILAPEGTKERRALEHLRIARMLGQELH